MPGERDFGPAVRDFAERAPIPRFFQVHRSDRRYESGKITLLPFTTFCSELDLPCAALSGYLTPRSLASVSNRRKLVYVALPVSVRDSIS